jgi:predicted transcriptional regulator
MPVRETSLAAYRDPNRRGGEQAARVAEYVRTHPLCSRKEVAKALSLETGTVSARVCELIEVGAVEEHGTKQCSVSKRTVAALRIPPIQPTLFS